MAKCSPLTNVSPHPPKSMDHEPYRLFPSCRFCIYILLMFGFACAGGGMNNIGSAITCMTAQSSKDINHNSTPAVCLARLNHTKKESKTPPYNWDTDMQGYVLAGSAWGALAVTLLSWLPDKIGSKWVFFTGAVVNGVMNFLTPLAARDVRALIVVRICQGLGSGVCWGNLGFVAALWSGRSELGVVTGIATSGLNLGSVFSFLTAGKMCETLGWESVFYMWGIICFIWAGAWFFIYADDLSKTALPITQVEIKHINRGKTAKLKAPIPWKQIFLCPYVWILGYTSLMANFYVYFVNDFLTTYIETVLLLPIDLAGYLSAIAPLAQFFARIGSGAISDKLTFLSLTTNIKLFTVICSLFPAVLLFAASTFDCLNVAGAVACLAAGFCFSAFCPAGYLKSIVHLAPSFASTISMFNAFMTYLSGVLVPFILPHIMPDYSLVQWRHSMYFVATCILTSTILYTLFGTAKTQPWGSVPDDGINSQEIEEGNPENSSNVERF